MGRGGHVYIVDDDAIIRRSLVLLLGEAGYACRPFAAGSDLVDALDYLEPGCILLDVNMPGLNGFDVQDHIADRRPDLPIVFMTAAGSIPAAVRVIKKGAIDFIEKPFSDEALFAIVANAQEQLQESVRAASRATEAAARLSTLTAREAEVMRSLLRGDTNKSVANELQLSIRTVEMHRANILRKIGVRSIAAAVHLASDAGMTSARVPAQYI